jgi:hypothetical protein
MHSKGRMRSDKGETKEKTPGNMEAFEGDGEVRKNKHFCSTIIADEEEI